MAYQRFDTQLLEAMRHRGDPLADSVIAELFSSHQIQDVNRLFIELVRNDTLPRTSMPAVVRRYLRETQLDHPLDGQRLQVSERLFSRFGPEILLVLGFYSLPSAYAARNGVQVLERTGYLKHRPRKRLLETCQMVVDVLRPGGLRPHGRGIRSAQKVRLMHAAVRHLITHASERNWQRAYGVPINQEDLAGTLMTFSFLVLDGLQKLQIRLTLEEREAFLYTWVEVGRLLGIDPALLPDNLDEAAHLTYQVYGRQVSESDEGRALTQALIETTHEMLPGKWLAGIPAALIRHFLAQDACGGRDVAAMLGVPAAPFTQALLSCLVTVNGRLNASLALNRVATSAIRRVSLAFIEGMLVLGDPRRCSFQIPGRLGREWGVHGAPDAPSNLHDASISGKRFGSLHGLDREP